MALGQWPWGSVVVASALGLPHAGSLAPENIVKVDRVVKDMICQFARCFFKWRPQVYSGKSNFQSNEYHNMS